MNLRVIFYLLLFTISSCTNSEEESFEVVTDNVTENEVKPLEANLTSINWLVGKWSDAAVNPQRQSHEIWWINENGELEGKEFFVKLYYDTTKITKHIIANNEQNEIEHKITSEGLQGISTVGFKLTSQGEDSIKFENPAHKWPQSIVYRKITPDSIVITLDGYVFESNKTLQFNMKKYTKFGYEIK